MDEKNQEIIKRFKESNKKFDEGQLFQDRKADELGFGITVLISLLLMIFKYFNNQPITDLLGIVFTGEGIADLFRYAKTKRKKMLWIGITYTILGVIFLLGYIGTVLGLEK